MRCNNSFSYHQLPFGEYKSWSPEKWCVIELGIYRCAINGDVQHLGGLCRCIYDLEVISCNNLVVSVSLRRVLQNHNPAGKYKYVQNKYGKKKSYIKSRLQHFCGYFLRSDSLHEKYPLSCCQFSRRNHCKIIFTKKSLSQFCFFFNTFSEVLFEQRVSVKSTIH